MSVATVSAFATSYALLTVSFVQTRYFVEASEATGGARPTIRTVLLYMTFLTRLACFAGGLRLLLLQTCRGDISAYFDVFHVLSGMRTGISIR